MVAGVDAGAWSDLVLPLSRHDLAIDSSNLDPGVDTGAVVGLDDGPSKGVLGSNRAVVWALGLHGHSTLGPAEGGNAISFKESVLLLDTEPGLSLLDLLHELITLVPGVGRDGGTESQGRIRIRKVRGAHHEDVRGATEGVIKDSARLKKDLGVLSRGLAGGRAVIVPDGKVLNRFRGRVERLGLATRLKTPAKPNILGLNYEEERLGVVLEWY